MSNDKIKRISKNLANLLLLFTRTANASLLFTEIEYYSTLDGGVIGIIAIDKYDKDYNIIILSRDESRQYHAENFKASIDTLSKARVELFKMMLDDRIIHHENSKFFDLFKSLKDKGQLHPHYELLKNNGAYSSAKEAIKEVSYHYKDIDGNFIDQFQSKNGFDARIWELYLYCFFKEQKFSFHREHEAPDYLVEKFEQKIAVEAVVISRKKKEYDVKEFKTVVEMNEDLENKIPLMVSNAIYEKVKKEYWNKEHVKGIPFLLAVADFHETSSMIWTYEAFLTTLFGVKPKIAKSDDGNPYQALDIIEKFTKDNGTEIPAGLFFQKEYENVSAIIYNPIATISKFNRMGRQAGLGTFESQLFWTAAYHDHTPGALLPIIKMHEIDESCTENWSMGATIFHNPNAKLPVNPDLFDIQVAHVFMENGKLLNLVPPIHPYQGWVVNNVKNKKGV